MKKRMEFSKLLALWATVMATLTAAASFILAACDKQTASDVSTTVFAACVGYLVTYAGKSLGEKMSRNKYRLDEYGRPYKEDCNDRFDTDN